MPRMLDVKEKPESVDGKALKPIERYGLKTMSIGYIVNEDTPMIWRGPMVSSALEQMLRDVQWGELDVLVVDMPPGTGDAQLTLAQRVALAGAVIVSTPQDIALVDARKGLNMFRKVAVPVLGFVENMSFYLCPHCGERAEIFGHGGAREEAEKLGVPFLGEVPLHLDIRTTSDSGHPIVVSQPDSPHAQIYKNIAGRVWKQLSANQRGAPRRAEDRGAVGLADGKVLKPFERYALTTTSIGYIVYEDTPMIWRGRMVSSASRPDAARRALGRARRAGGRHAAGHRRCAAHARPARGAGRHGDRVDAAGHRADRCPQGPEHVPQGRGAGPRHRREHELSTSARIAASAPRSSATAAARGGREARRAVPGRGAACISTSARRRTAGHPIVVSQPDSPHAQVYKNIAGRVWKQLSADARARKAPTIVRAVASAPSLRGLQARS